MNIGILGSGNMGRSMGMVWAEMGHALFFGDIGPDKARAVAQFVNRNARNAAQPLAEGGTVEQAAERGQVLLHTARGVVLSRMLPSLVPVQDKVIIDCNNETSRRPLRERTISHAERLAQDAPRAHIVKAFNTISQETFEHCSAGLEKFQVSCFVCGDSEPAVRTVLALAEEMGFAPVDCGPLHNACFLEVFGDFIRVMIKQSGGDPYHGFSFRPLPPCPQPRLGGRHPPL